MSEEGSHRFLPDTTASGEILVGLACLGGGIASLLGVYDDWYVGFIPARYFMPLGIVIGLAMVVDGVRRLGGIGATMRVLGGWLAARTRWWLMAGAVAAILGGVVAWELYTAPQVVTVVGLADEEVKVEIPGPEGYTHTVSPGSEVEFALERGRHVIGVVVGDARREHEVVHDGWPSSEPLVIDAAP